MDEHIRILIGDLLLAGKARRGFQNLWEMRKRDLKALISGDPSPQFYVKHPDGTYSEWPSHHSATANETISNTGESK